MANLSETSTYEAGIYQLETGDPVEGGPDGISNVQAIQLANRTRYLRDRFDHLKTYNVRDFGAVGDGAANDTAAVQAALNAAEAGSVVVVPSGTYLVDGITIGAALRLVGPGTIAARIATVDLVRVTAADAVIDGLVIRGNALAERGVSIYAGDSSPLPRVRVQHCDIRNTKNYGILVPAGDQTQLRYNHIEAIGDGSVNDTFDMAGIYFSISATDVVVEGNQIVSPSHYGICFAAGSGCRVTRNTIRSSSFIGIGQQFCTEHLLAENLVTACGDNGIDAQLCDQVTIVGNHCVGNGASPSGASRAGIFCGSDTAGVYANRAVIANNICRGNGGVGIQLVRLDTAQVTGNASDGNKSLGLSVGICRNITITGNTVSGTRPQVAGGSATGLYLTDCTGVVVSANVVRNNGDPASVAVDKVSLYRSAGIAIVGGTNLGISLLGNEVYDNSGAGILVINDTGGWCSRIVIANNQCYDSRRVVFADVVPATGQKYGIYIDTDYSGTSNHLVRGILVLNNVCSNNYRFYAAGALDPFVGAQVQAIRVEGTMRGQLDYAESGAQAFFPAGATTPSVRFGRVFVTQNSGGTGITDFLDGTDGQEITVLVDGFTSLVHGAKIKLVGGVNFAGTADDTITLVRVSGVWYEKSRSVNG